MESAIKQIARRIDRRDREGVVNEIGRQRENERVYWGQGETPQRQWGSFDSRANWNAADANDDGAGVGIPSTGKWGLQGSCKSRCNRGIGGAYISHRVVARDIEAYLAFVFSPCDDFDLIVQLYLCKSFFVRRFTGFQKFCKLLIYLKT